MNELLDPIKPGEILRDDFMEPLNISIKQLAVDISVHFNKISEIINGKRAITVDTALRLQRYFGVEAKFWLNLQCEYDLRIRRNYMTETNPINQVIGVNYDTNADIMTFSFTNRPKPAIAEEIDDDISGFAMTCKRIE
jgi:antitoxin HigA-1